MFTWILVATKPQADLDIVDFGRDLVVYIFSWILLATKPRGYWDIDVLAGIYWV